MDSDHALARAEAYLTRLARNADDGSRARLLWAARVLTADPPGRRETPEDADALKRIEAMIAEGIAPAVALRTVAACTYADETAQRNAVHRWRKKRRTK